MTDLVQLLVWLGIGGLLYYAWHHRRYPKIGCWRCDGKGSFQSRSLFTGQVVSRPCPSCRGRTPWRRRKGLPPEGGG